jgi:RNA polymerase sporulation-specific sigma factor
MSLLNHVKNFFRKIFNFIIDKLGSAKELFYIGGSDTLPPPLSQEEEKEIINRLKDSDEAKTILIEHNLRLVVYLAKKFESTGINVEDLISIGTIGLIKAVNTFKAEKNIKLATYASKCIENEILMHLRRVGKAKTEISLDEPLNIDWDGNELLLSDILGTEEDVVFKDMENEVDLNLLNDSIKKLSKREYTIMKLRFGLNNSKSFTQKEVADMLGISQSYISRLEKKILNRLKKEINKAV